MRQPNTLMKNLLGNNVLASNTSVVARIVLLSGDGVLSPAERAVLQTETGNAYLYQWSSIVAEFTKNRQQAAMYTSGPLPRSQGIGVFGLSFSEATFTLTGDRADVEIGLMLLFIGISASQYNIALALSVGPVGSGADVEINNTTSTLNMLAMHGDLILNFE